MYGTYGDFTGFDSYTWGDPALADYAGTGAFVTGDIPASTAAMYASTAPEMSSTLANTAGFNPSGLGRAVGRAIGQGLPTFLGAATGATGASAVAAAPSSTLLRDGLIGVGALLLVGFGTWALVKG